MGIAERNMIEDENRHIDREANGTLGQDESDPGDCPDCAALRQQLAEARGLMQSLLDCRQLQLQKFCREYCPSRYNADCPRSSARSWLSAHPAKETPPGVVEAVAVSQVWSASHPAERRQP